MVPSTSPSDDFRECTLTSLSVGTPSPTAGLLLVQDLRAPGVREAKAEGLVDSAWKKEAMALKEIGNWHYGLLGHVETACVGRGFSRRWMKQPPDDGMTAYDVVPVT